MPRKIAPFPVFPPPILLGNAGEAAKLIFEAQLYFRKLVAAELPVFHRRVQVTATNYYEVTRVHDVGRILIFAAGGEMRYEFYSTDLDIERHTTPSSPEYRDANLQYPQGPWVKGRLSRVLMRGGEAAEFLPSFYDGTPGSETIPSLPGGPEIGNPQHFGRLSSGAYATWVPGGYTQQRMASYTWWPNFNGARLMTSSLGGDPNYSTFDVGIASPYSGNGSQIRRYKENDWYLPPVLREGIDGAITNAAFRDGSKYWRKACIQVVEHEEHGARTFIIQTVETGEFQIAPLFHEPLGSFIGAGAVEGLQTVKPPWPGWVTLDGSGNPEVPTSWRFNSLGSRAVCCPVERVDAASPASSHDFLRILRVYRPANQPNPGSFWYSWLTDVNSLAAAGIPTGIFPQPFNDIPGLFEVAINIELTGPDPADFVAGLIPTVTKHNERFFINADYAFPLLLGEAASEGNQLITAELELYTDIPHQLGSTSLNFDPDPADFPTLVDMTHQRNNFFDGYLRFYQNNNLGDAIKRLVDITLVKESLSEGFSPVPGSVDLGGSQLVPGYDISTSGYQVLFSGQNWLRAILSFDLRAAAFHGTRQLFGGATALDFTVASDVQAYDQVLKNFQDSFAYGEIPLNVEGSGTYRVDPQVFPFEYHVLQGLIGGGAFESPYEMISVHPEGHIAVCSDAFDTGAITDPPDQKVMLDYVGVRNPEGDYDSFTHEELYRGGFGGDRDSDDYLTFGPASFRFMGYWVRG